MKSTEIRSSGITKKPSHSLQSSNRKHAVYPVVCSAGPYRTGSTYRHFPLRSI